VSDNHLISCKQIIEEVGVFNTRKVSGICICVKVNSATASKCCCNSFFDKSARSERLTYCVTLMAAMVVDQPDSLEGWVAIKDRPFVEKCSRKSKLVFHVAWNDVESRVAVTCRRSGESTVTPTAWTGAFAFSELRAINDQLSLVHPSLAQYLPPLPAEPRGLWAYFVHVEPPDESICVDIHRYLNAAFEICGEALLTSTLFEEHGLDEYFEKISELRRRSFDEAVARAEEQLDSVLFLCEGSINMLDMGEVYKQEDEVNYVNILFL